MDGDYFHSQSYIQLKIPIKQNIKTSSLECSQKFFCFQHIFQFVMITKKSGIRRQHIISNLGLDGCERIINMQVMQGSG